MDKLKEFYFNVKMSAGMSYYYGETNNNIVYCGVIKSDCGVVGHKIEYIKSLDLYSCNKCGHIIPQKYNSRYAKILKLK